MKKIEIYLWKPNNFIYLDSTQDGKEIKPVNPKGNKAWMFIGRIDVEPETPIFWPPDVKSWLIWKEPDAGKDWGQEEKGKTEDEMVGWYHRLSGCEFEHSLGVGDGQGGLACCSSWGPKELDMTERLNWTETQFKRQWHKVKVIWTFVSKWCLYFLYSV